MTPPKDLRLYGLLPQNRNVVCLNCSAFAKAIKYIQHRPDCPPITQDPADKKARDKATLAVDQAYERNRL